MATIHMRETTTATAAQYIAGLTDFGPGRAELFGKLSLQTHQRAGDQVAVAAQVLRHRVDDDVGPQQQRLLQDRGREGVVDRNQGTSSMREVRSMRSLPLSQARRPKRRPPNNSTIICGTARTRPTMPICSGELVSS